MNMKKVRVNQVHVAKGNQIYDLFYTRKAIDSI